MPQRYQRPREQAVGAVILGEDDRVLLVKRGRPPRVGTWSLPGGKVEGKEALETAIVREVLEETGLTVRVRAPLGVVRLSREGFRYDIHEFLCSVDGSPDATPGDDASEVVWADRAELARLGVSLSVSRVIGRARALDAGTRRPP
jgi:8-oxo-dGTP diphosphatase